MKKTYKLLWMILCCTVLLYCSSSRVFAEVTLPSGGVKGLPKGLTAVDEDGNDASSDTGRYYFDVPDMNFGETYTKKVQIMNLREDKAYHIYFYAEPISQKGEINLQDWCSSSIYLDDKKVYSGKITGEGDTNISKTPIDLGLFEPGKSRTMKVDVIWDDPGDYGGLVNYGRRYVDINGVTILEGASGQNYVSGETLFRWIFYAVVDESYKPPKTGILAEESVWYILIFAAAAACAIVALALLKKKKYRKEN